LVEYIEELAAETGAGGTHDAAVADVAYANLGAGDLQSCWDKVHRAQALEVVAYVAAVVEVAVLGSDAVYRSQNSCPLVVDVAVASVQDRPDPGAAVETADRAPVGEPPYFRSNAKTPVP
jgi:hypothetical protein